MKIGELAGLLIGTELIGDGETEIIGIEMHSLKVKQGDLFVCTPGIPGFLEDRAAYADAPDGLEKALATIREAAGGGRIIAVFGCGGNRDRAKRPVMGRIASTYADYVVITSDNPRKEDPWQIMRDIEQGIDGRGAPGRYAMLADRRDAIFEAIRMAEPGDTVFIAGKGHETYQIIGGETHHFDDREVAAEAIMDRMGRS